MTRRRSDYGPVQLSVTSLGLELWQFARARQAGLIPCPDRPRNRWSAQVAGAALARAREIRQAAGSIPDVGAVRAAEVLSTRLGAVVTGDGVAELARRGLIPVTGHFRDWPLYDGRALEAFTGLAAAADATWAGHLRTADQSAAYLRIRRCDLGHLTRAGLLTPTGWGHGPFDRRDRFSVPLYRTGDLDDLAARAGIAPLRPAVAHRWPRCHPPHRKEPHHDRSPRTHPRPGPDRAPGPRRPGTARSARGHPAHRGRHRRPDRHPADRQHRARRPCHPRR
jgi:hypothetical protein